MFESAFPPIVAVMAPTATGKSQIALALAERLNGEIVSVDSALVYRGMDIGTAKPTLAERARIPHHLVDIVDPEESFSAGQFRRRAQEVIAQIRERGRLPILVGGTFLYFRALLEGFAELPAADPDVRAALDAEATKIGWHALHERLAAVDPASAARIHANDAQRIQRALETYLLTGKPLSEHHAKGCVKGILPAVKLSLAWSESEFHERRIRERFMAMLDLGFVEEVRCLKARTGAHVDLSAFRAVGYRQVWGYLEARYDFATMVEMAIIATRQYAKRQRTWLRRESLAATYVSDHEGVIEQIVNDLIMTDDRFSISQG